MINEIIKVNSQYIHRVTSFLNKNELYIKPNFEPFTVNNIEKCKIYEPLTKTEEIYYHSLLIIKDLIKYSLTSESDYSKIAFKIINNWWKTYRDNEMAWNEHAVSERVLNLIYFQENSTKIIRRKKFKRILEQHLNFLYESKNYKENNHGLMMDRSLLIGGYYTNNDIYTELAIIRFKTFIYRDFSSSGIHLENSPEYHELALKIIKEFLFTMQILNIKIHGDVKRVIKKSEIYIRKLAKHDGTIPILGDSGHKKINIKKAYGNIVDHTSGVFLYQDLDYKNWLLLSNGYESITHKHKDDMSIQFSIDSFNILDDSGKYNYDSTSKVRRYLVSDYAHSKPFIKEKLYKFDGQERLKTNIILNTEDLYHIEVSYIKPRDFSVLRNVILHKKTSSLIIIDRFSSNEDLTFCSNFVINPDVDIDKLAYNEINFLNTSYTIKTNIKAKIISKFDDDSNFYSKNFNDYIHTNRIEIISKGNESIHVSQLSSQNTNIKINIHSENVFLELNDNEYIVNISKIKRW